MNRRSSKYYILECVCLQVPMGGKVIYSAGILVKEVPVIEHESSIRGG